MSALEDLLAFQVRALGLPEPRREHRFSRRLFRWDFAWPKFRLAVEIEGGMWDRSLGHHQRPLRYQRDCEKGNLGVLLGWRLLRYTGDQVRSGIAVREIEAMIKGTAMDSYMRDLFVGPAA